MQKKSKIAISFCMITIVLIGLIVVACNTGSIRVSAYELFHGLFIEYNETVKTIYDLRFPRIFVAMFAGAGFAVSGVLFQAVLKNPLADPSMIGVSSGASLAAIVVMAFHPSAYFVMPVFALIGGIISFLLVYTLSFKNGLSPIRILLVGIAVRSIFDGIISAFSSMGGSTSSAANVVNSNITMKTWSDVKMIAIYVGIGILCSFCLAHLCNLLALEDKTARSLGINVTAVRMVVSVAAVLLASSATAVAGVISFLGLIVPHMARLIIGADHKVLVPFSALLGAFLLLLADTIGRIICAPYEISASIIMAVLGGPCFILLLRRNKKI